MKQINLSILPNQSFSVQLDEIRYDFTIKSTAGIMMYDMKRDNEYVLRGQRIVAGAALIPYRYKEKGNFVILVENDDLPDYTKFGISQKLYYLSEIELLSLRA